MLKQQIDMLEYLFDYFNKSKFGGTLPRAVITIQSAGRKKCIGWCTVDKVWYISGEEDEGYFEINICTEAMSLGTMAVAEILLHEMVHFCNSVNNIKDCSKAGKHNKKFRDLAESVGLIVEQGDAGWNMTSFSKETYREVLDLNVVDVFNLIRVTPKKVKPSKKPKFEYKCPQCNAKLTSSDDGLEVKCIKCDTVLDITEK